MEKNIYEIVVDLLKTEEKYISDDGELVKAKIEKDIRNMDANLIKKLLSNDKVKKQFFEEVEGTYVFDKNKFAWFIQMKEFLPDSYTMYTNKIGLTYNNSFLSEVNDVVIDFPYKDCYLEGGQTKEDEKKDEIMYHEIIASDEINRMLSPKVFTNAKRYSAIVQKDLSGEIIPETIEIKEETGIEFKEDDNLIIKGNNLLAISSLLKRYEGKIKLIYIDPPYNTGGDGFKYNDRFNHSTWLLFMKNRLEIAKKLLSDDGSIYVQIDNKEAHYLRVLMDEVFGRNNFRSEIIWDTSVPYVAGNKWLSNNWIYSYSSIMYYAKEKENVSFNKLTFDVKQKSGDISKKPYKDVWTDIQNFAGFLGAKDIKIQFNSRKPEALMERIIKASTNPGDLVLDFHLGSGTTTAVAHKMGRRYIGIEQMDYIKAVSIERMKEVLKGEQAGISKTVNWKGGGSFVYCELKENALELINEISSATEESINKIKDKVYNDDRLVYYIKKSELETGEEEFNRLSLEEKKQALIHLLNKNKLYINYCDLDDEDYKVTEEEKIFTKSFYERE